MCGFPGTKVALPVSPVPLHQTKFDKLSPELDLSTAVTASSSPSTNMNQLTVVEQL